MIATREHLDTPRVRRLPTWIRGRWRLIAVFWLVEAVAAYLLSIPLIFIVFGDGSSILTEVGSLLFVAVFMSLQVLFLLPVRRPRVSTRGVPILISLAIGGFLAAALALAAAAAIVQVINVYSAEEREFSGWLPLGVMGAAWLVSTPLLIAFCRRGPRERLLQRLSTALFLGTMIEAAAIIPLDVLVRRREECICGTGTYLSLTICCAVGLFVLGPAVLLPLLAERRRRWYAGHCEVCGYDMRGRRRSDHCPECGAGWRRSTTS